MAQLTILQSWTKHQTRRMGSESMEAEESSSQLVQTWRDSGNSSSRVQDGQKDLSEI